jgi:hypothetical protein
MLRVCCELCNKNVADKTSDTGRYICNSCAAIVDESRSRWDAEIQPVLESLRNSERLTAEDMAVRINTRAE